MFCTRLYSEIMVRSVARIALEIAFFVSVFRFTAADDSSIGTTIRFTRLVCVDQPYPLSTVERCELKLFRNKPSQMNMVIQFSRIEKMYFSVEWFVKTVGHRPMFPKMVIDVCAVLDGRLENMNPIVDHVYLTIKKFAGHLLTRPCPIEGLYNTGDLVIPHNFTLPLMPPGNYYVAIRTYDEKNRTGLHLHLHGSIRQTGLLG